MSVKEVLEAAEKKAGDYSKLQRELVRRGAKVGVSTLTQSVSRDSRSLRSDVLAALCDFLFEGDWQKLGKLIERNAKRTA